jgi:hypothetical protein
VRLCHHTGDVGATRYHGSPLAARPGLRRDEPRRRQVGVADHVDDAGGELGQHPDRGIAPFELPAELPRARAHVLDVGQHVSSRENTMRVMGSSERSTIVSNTSVRCLDQL